VKRLGLEKRVNYLEYLDRDKDRYKLFETVSRAKVCLYPSHSDAFSLVILESLAVGTPIVAYDIPGPKSVFHGLPIVKFVREFDKKGMAETALRIINSSNSDYEVMVNNQKVLEFLKVHSSWDAVAKNLAEKIYVSA
jgi:glycosyltransferase involved in cell wall biosynthesis